MIDLKKLVSKKTKEILNTIYEKGNPKNRRILSDTLKEELDTEEDFRKFEELLESNIFQKYLIRSKNYSYKRFSSTIRRICDRIKRKIDNKIILDIIETILSPDYIKNISMYLKDFSNDELYSIFENLVMDIVEVDKYLVEIVYYISELKYFFYLWNSDILNTLIPFIKNYIINKKSKEEIVVIIENFLKRDVVSIIQMFEKHIEDTLTPEFFLFSLFKIFLTLNISQLPVLFNFLESIKRKVVSKEKDITQKKRIILNFLFIWENINQNKVNKLFDFLEKFPYYNEGDASYFVFDALLNAPKEKIEYYLDFFTSIDFFNFYKNYCYNKKIFKFLFDNMLAVISETNENVNSFLLVILQVLIKQRINKRFLERRRDFIEWLSKKTKSEIIRSVYIKMFLFEYVLIHKNKYEENQGNITLTKFLDNFHKIFCILIDDEKFNLKEKREEIYTKLYEIGRSKAYGAVFNRHSKYERNIKELSSIAEGYEIDDFAISEMLKVEPEFFIYYYNKIIETFKNYTDNPEKVREAFSFDYWCRLYFEKANFYIVKEVLPLIGSYPLFPNKENNSAYTDGKSIFLPYYISYFQDSFSDMYNNRNLAIYIGLAFHEAGHIIGGTFKFDLKYLILKQKYPQIFYMIYNIFEDYRVERYLIKIKAHPQIKELIDNMNAFFLISILSKKNSDIVEFFLYMAACAEEINEVIEKNNPKIKENMERILSLNLPTGRFSSMKELLEYGIERLKNLDIIDIFSTYYLALEFFEIIKNWPEEKINEFFDNFFKNIKGDLQYGNKDIVSRVVLAEEGLKRLQLELKENPVDFYRGIGLPSFIISEKEEKGESTGEESITGKDRVTNLLNQTGFDYIGLPFKFDDNIIVPLKRVEKDKDSKEKKNIFDEIGKEIRNFFEKKKKSRTTKIVKRKRVISLNEKTDTKTVIANCNEVEIRRINHKFLLENRQFRNISDKIYKMLERLLTTKKFDIVEPSDIDGEVNMERLIEILIDKKNCVNTDFLEIEVENKKSLKVIIGIDISGSTIDTIDKDLTVLDVEKHFALIFSNALKLITKNIDAYAFNSDNDTTVYHAVPIEALSSFCSGRYNRDGDFIRYINYIFSKSNEEIKYFFLISDGKPNAPGYEGKYALDDTILAMKECKKKNIKLVYFNIDRSKADYFPELKEAAFYGEHFSNPLELIDIIPELVSSIVKEVI